MFHARKKLLLPLQNSSFFALLAAVVIVILAATVRTYKLTTPLGDWHSFRQVDTAAVTREYVRDGIDLLHPRYHDVSNIQSGELNLDGWRMVEFPLMNALTAGILRIWPQLDLVVTSRVVSLVASLISLAAMMWIAYRFWGTRLMILAGGVFSFLPYSIFYSRVVLPEPFMVMWAMLAAVAIERWSARLNERPVHWRYHAWLLVAGVFFALALLVKPMAVFFLPFIIGVFWQQRPKAFWPWMAAAVVVGISALPMMWWREWILQFPTGIPASDWLFNGNGIRFKPAWWRWIFADRIGRLMFGNWGAGFLGLGFIAGVPILKKSKNWRSWWKLGVEWLQTDATLIFGLFGMLAYVSVFATGNVQHDYYQILLVPILALVWARGADWLIATAQGAAQVFSRYLLIGIILFLSIVFAWYEVEGWYNINNPAFVPAGEAVRRHTEEDDLIIAPGFGDTTFLFHTERWGWPIGFEIEDKIAAGAQYYVSTAYDDEARRLEEDYTVLEKTDLYILIDLQQPKEMNE